VARGPFPQVYSMLPRQLRRRESQVRDIRPFRFCGKMLRTFMPHWVGCRKIGVRPGPSFRNGHLGFGAAVFVTREFADAELPQSRGPDSRQDSSRCTTGRTGTQSQEAIARSQCRKRVGNLACFNGKAGFESSLHPGRGLMDVADPVGK